MTVLEIVRQYLETNGYDGLYDDGECACKLHDLAPCGSIGHECKAGYLLPGDSDFDFCIGQKEPKP